MGADFRADAGGEGVAHERDERDRGGRSALHKCIADQTDNAIGGSIWADWGQQFQQFFEVVGLRKLNLTAHKERLQILLSGLLAVESNNLAERFRPLRAVPRHDNPILLSRTIA